MAAVAAVAVAATHTLGSSGGGGGAKSFDTIKGAGTATNCARRCEAEKKTPGARLKLVCYHVMF